LGGAGVTKWLKDIARITRDGVLHMSVPFTWLMPKARALADRHAGDVVVGGPGAALAGCDWAEVRPEAPPGMDFLRMHNPDATVTTRGCPRRCAFCAVPRIEGAFRELSAWRPRPVECSNNLLAASRGHFERVIDSMTPFPATDFNQGLDARLFTSWHAGQVARLHKPVIRFAFDHVDVESSVADAIATARAAGLRDVRVYVLVGFRDAPEDALYRLETVRSWGIRPNPMRYQPLDVTEKDSFVPPGWSSVLLHDVMRYYSRLRWLEHVSFDKYRAHENARRFNADLTGHGERIRFWRRIILRGRRARKMLRASAD
jgi:hypothetical protein